MRIFVLSIISAAILLGSSACSSQQVSDDPVPVWQPVITSVTGPASTTAGDTVNVGVNWVTGQAPFTVAWALGGGGTVEILTVTTSDRTAGSQFTLAGQPQTVTYTGTAQVTDFYGQVGVQNFTFTVNGTN